MVAKKRVFISYAWESDDFRNSVWELAGWLVAASEGKMEVITDHLFSVRPPAQGWHRWMQQEIEKCDIVFSICTKKYKAAFEGNLTGLEGGFGSTHEGLLITAVFYQGRGENNKFYPIIPDDGTLVDIPLILQAWNNQLKFHSGNQNIYNLVMGENPSHDRGTGNQLQNIAEQTIELEKELTQEISNAVATIVDNMNFDVQVLVRAYLALSDVEKDEVISEVAGELELPQDDPDEKDRLFLATITDDEKLEKLWSAINLLSPFENPNNPFKTL